MPVVRQRRVFILTPRHAPKQESRYSCYLNTRALPCPIRKRLLLTQSQSRLARAPALHLNTTPGTARSSTHTDCQSLRLDNTECEVASMALQYRTFGGKNGGLGWHILHITLASTFCYACPACTASALGSQPTSSLVLE